MTIEVTSIYSFHSRGRCSLSVQRHIIHIDVVTNEWLYMRRAPCLHILCYIGRPFVKVV